MHKELAKKDKVTRRIPWIPIVLVAFVGVLIILAISENRSQKRMRESAYRLVCGTRLAGLGRTMREYCDEFHEYPAPDKWCDLLSEYAELSEDDFKCSANKGARCGFAMNPAAHPDGPPDMVVLFEAKGGWNQYGGPELLTLENHREMRCHVFFNDGQVRFVRAEEIAELNWKGEEKGKRIE